MGNTTHSSSNEETIGPFGLIWSMRPSAQGTLAAVFLHTTCRKGFLTKCYKKNKNKNKKNLTIPKRKSYTISLIYHYYAC
jgi:hypothetical protein